MSLYGFITTGLLIVTKVPVEGPMPSRVLLPTVKPLHTALLVFLLLALTTWSGCSPAEPDSRSVYGKGGRRYGGVFNYNEAGSVRGLFPLGITQLSSYRSAAQVYEGLVRIDGTDLSVKPALASSWDVDPTGTIYTFRMRQGVRFHDDACFENGSGREMTAEDVLYCFTELCTPGPANQLAWLLQDLVVGAGARINAAMAGTALPPVQGFEVLPDGRFRITLNSPAANFMQVLAHQGCWIYPREMVAHYGDEMIWHPVGTGPFVARSVKVGNAIVLERNIAYWDVDEHGNALPFLDGVRVTFEQDRSKEWDAFESGTLTYYAEPDRSALTALAARGSAQPSVLSAAGLSVQFYGFSRFHLPFTDRRVRQAFSLAIDRRALVDSLLGDLALPAQRGMVPPGFSDYPYDSVPLLRYDPDRGKQLLQEAGYNSGAELPTVYLQVSNDGPAYVRVASAVQVMLERNLGVQTVVSVLPAEQHFVRVERAQAQFWREGWVADHPDPENFLALFYGRNAPSDTTEPSFLNSTRYRNQEFDRLFQAAQSTIEPEERMRLLAHCERILMEDAVVLPLYHERMVRVLQPWVRDLPINGMDFLQLRSAWFDRQDR
ncbi:MAG: ABC transporter substrate-binding protein [Elusimicrobia bacterium]|nr:MAG: ABC transporter substrate-binding protein [Elusimicrobiota bacterium]